MIGKKKREELVGIGYTAGDLAQKSKDALYTGDEYEMIKRILKNQVFLLTMLAEQFTQME